MVYISYTMLQSTHGGVLFECVPFTAHLCPSDPDCHCLVLLPEKYHIFSESGRCRHIRLPLGSTCTLEYRGATCPLQIGRKILIKDVES